MTLKCDVASRKRVIRLVARATWIGGFLIIIGLITLPQPAMANIPMWPFLGLVHLSFWWFLPMDVVIEAVAIRLLFDVPWKRSVWLSLAINAATFALGFVLYPPSGFVLYQIFAPVIASVFGVNRLVEGTAIAFGAGLIDATIELFLLKRAFSMRLNWHRVGGLLFANFLTAAILVAAIFYSSNDRMQQYAKKVEEMELVAERYTKELLFMSGIRNSLYWGEDISDVQLEPAWIELRQSEAQSLEFIDLAIVIRTGEGYEDVDVTFLVGTGSGHDQTDWLDDDTEAYPVFIDSGRGFARSTAPDGTVTYRTRQGYSTGRYSITILAAFADPN